MHLSTVTVAGLLITQASEQNVPSLSLISHKKKTDKQRWLTIRLRIIRSSVTSRGSCTSHYQIQENVKKNQDWLVIDRFNVHSTLRVQSSDAFLYNNCFRNIFRSCWTRSFLLLKEQSFNLLCLIGIIQTQNLSWEWHLNISIIIFLVAWIQFFFSWNINHSFNILNGQKYKYKSSHNFNLNVNAIGTPSLRCNQNSHFSVFQSLTRYSLHNILLHGT